MTKRTRPRRPAPSINSTSFRSRLIATLRNSESDGVKLEDVLIRQLITRAMRGDDGALRTIFRIVDDEPSNSVYAQPAAPPKTDQQR